MRLKITIKGDANEITALVLAVQGREGPLVDLEEEVKRVLEKISQKKPNRVFQ